MLADSFIFVLSVLISITLSIFYAFDRQLPFRLRDKVYSYRYGRIGIFIILCILLLFLLYLLIEHVSYRWHTSTVWPGIGTLLAILLGAVVGTFSARAFLSLFATNFGREHQLAGAIVLGLLIVVYTLSTYRGELGALFSGLGLSALKIPGYLELAFSDRAQYRGGIIPATGPSGNEKSSALPRPNDPRPGIESLKGLLKIESQQATAPLKELGVLDRDIRYTHYFGANVPDDLWGVKPFLKPFHTLSICLAEYVKSFPDARLVLIDIKPIMHSLYLMHANTLVALKDGEVWLSVSYTYDEAKKVNVGVNKVKNNILEALRSQTLELPMKSSAQVPSDYGNLGSSVSNETLKPDQSCEMLPPLEIEASSITYLQPYTTIILAHLLVSYGSPDQAIEVLAEWLHHWRCARGAPSANECHVQKVDEALKLPEWLGIRAEFEISTLLYNLAGPGNIAHREFLMRHSENFKEYAGGKLSIEQAHRRCLDKKPLDEEHPEEASAILVSLLANENDLLRSDIYFLSEYRSWDVLERRFNRARSLIDFRADCVLSKPTPDDVSKWEKTRRPDFMITAGILGSAIADAMNYERDSLDLLERANEIKTISRQYLLEGYRDLKETCTNDRERFTSTLPVHKRVFTVSAWEGSCSLAERAISQLRRAR